MTHRRQNVPLQSRGLDKPLKNNYTTNRKGAVRNGQLLPVRSIRMTATVWRLGRSFLIVMDLFEDCPCDLKCNPNCAANNDEQLQNIVQHHDASPLPRLRTGEQTISFYVPRTLAGGKHDHLRLQVGLRHPASASLSLASCWPRPQQLLLVSATGSSRRCCSTLTPPFGVAFLV